MCLLAKKRKGLKSFLAESREKNWNYLFYPSAKGRRELKIKTLGVTFRGASAYYVQKSIAPRKQAVCRYSFEFFFDENVIETFCHFFVFDVEKWNVGNRLKRVFPKFRADRSHPRGVNGGLKILHPNKPSPPKKKMELINRPPLNFPSVLINRPPGDVY